jgi:hypothetical protein
MTPPGFYKNQDYLADSSKVILNAAVSSSARLIFVGLIGKTGPGEEEPGHDSGCILSEFRPT